MAIAPVTYAARQDSGTANNAALNLTGTPALDITFVAETAGGGTGDLWLDQPAGGGVDPDTQVQIGGTSYSFTYELSGTLPTLKKHGAQQVPDQYEGSDVVIITVHDYPSAGETMRFAFMPNEGATLADMDAFGTGAINVQNADTTPAPTPICFLSGAMILTPRGEAPVEALQAGDLVMTLDAGPMPIRWVSFTRHNWPDVPAGDKPILIAAGALGDGRPHRDLMVSPQHRILLRGPGVVQLFGDSDVLAPAKGLTSLGGVRWMNGKRQADYHHLLLDRHAIIQADGALTESFYPGPTALRMLTQEQRDEIRGLFPALRTDPAGGYGPLARHGLTRQETEAFLRIRRQIDGSRPGEAVLAA